MSDGAFAVLFCLYVVAALLEHRWHTKQLDVLDARIAELNKQLADGHKAVADALETSGAP